MRSISRAVFSPHTRGCSVGAPQRRRRRLVFPAYAGMFRTADCWRIWQDRFPRIRGDVPAAWLSNLYYVEFSPHTRGCSLVGRLLCTTGVVFPAYAGMFRLCRLISHSGKCFPRIRGDVPAGGESNPQPQTFSPHTRGCSADEGCRVPPVDVFPAYAGMFLIEGDTNLRHVGFPRIRGDVPRFGSSSMI